jgi:hypothetical protein
MQRDLYRFLVSNGIVVNVAERVCRLYADPPGEHEILARFGPADAIYEWLEEYDQFLAERPTLQKWMRKYRYNNMYEGVSITFCILETGAVAVQCGLKNLSVPEDHL